MATNHKLTYFAARRRWKKKHRGKVYYVGPVGVTKGDHAAYREALKEWGEIEAGLSKQAERDELNRVRDEHADALLAVDAARDDPTNRVQMALARAVVISHGVEDHPDFQLGEAAPGDLEGLVSTFVETHARRQKNGGLSAGRFDQIRRDAQHFRDWGTQRMLQPREINAATVEDYHGQIMDDIASGAISRSYGRGRWVTFRMLIEWAWEREACDLPRNLKARRFAINVPTTKVKTYPLDDLREIMDAAADKTKLYLLLMLNCGMYQSDISDLHPSEVTLGRNPRITRKRSKTGDVSKDVPEVSYPLWKPTAVLLHEHQGADPKRILTNASGEPLRIDHIEDGKLRRLDAIRSAVRRTYTKVNRARMKEGGKPMPLHDLKLLRKTSADAITQNPDFGGRIADLFLGHSPRSMREKHYSGPEQKQLDRAVKWLGQLLILENR